MCFALSSQVWEIVQIICHNDCLQFHERQLEFIEELC